MLPYTQFCHQHPEYITSSNFEPQSLQFTESERIWRCEMTYFGFELVRFLSKFLDINWIFGQKIQDRSHCIGSRLIPCHKEYKELKIKIPPCWNFEIFGKNSNLSNHFVECHSFCGRSFLFLINLCIQHEIDKVWSSTFFDFFTLTFIGFIFFSLRCIS